MISILYDGWPLSYHPNSPSALHLLTLLEACSPTVEPVVLLPASPPEWFPARITTRLEPTPNTSRAHLNWEQRTLPRFARSSGIKVVHLTSLTPVMISPLPTVISPAGFGISEPWRRESLYKSGYANILSSGGSRAFADRLRWSLAAGALDRVNAILWPEDLPYPPDQRTPNNLQKMPPTVHPAFLTQQTRPAISALGDLPETYFLYHGPSNPRAFQTLFQAWSWVDRSLGEACRLVLVGVEETERQMIVNNLPEYNLEKTVQALPILPPQELAGVYQGSSGLFHPALVPLWEGPLRQALASGRPIVATKTHLAEALVGPAAYLIDEQDTRAMGAALITVIVEESIAARLSQAAQQRSLQWNPALFQEKLGALYKTLGENR
jgi:glycosyltransferase involved in cell wall biosynthesis